MHQNLHSTGCTILLSSKLAKDTEKSVEVSGYTVPLHALCVCIYVRVCVRALIGEYVRPFCLLHLHDDLHIKGTSDYGNLTCW